MLQKKYVHGTSLSIVGNKIAPNVEQHDYRLRLQDPTRGRRYSRLLLDEKTTSSAAGNAERCRDSLVQKAGYPCKPKAIRTPAPGQCEVCEAQMAALGDAGGEAKNRRQDRLGRSGI
jgi:hypothetical protein